jgi:hypothetical protein
MRRTFLSVAMVAVAAACTSDGSSPDPVAPIGKRAITGGTPTGPAYGSVGALLFDFNGDGVIDGDDLWCSGSLIAPTLFLTAGHCVASAFTNASTQFYVSFSPDLYGASFAYVAATGAVADPLFGRDVANLHDLALVFLPAGSTAGMTPLQLPPPQFLTGLSAKAGLRKQTFVNVGYGVSASSRGLPRFQYDGLRRQSTSAFMALQPTWLGLLMNTAATGQGGDCYGDSGSPKFLDGNPNMIVATVTSGDVACRATTWDWRLDTPEARGFLGQYVTLPQ